MGEKGPPPTGRSGEIWSLEIYMDNVRGSVANSMPGRVIITQETGPDFFIRSVIHDPYSRRRASSFLQAD